MPLHFGIEHGMRGYYALIYNDYNEVIQTGIGSYSNAFDAIDEAIDWARSEGADREVMRLMEQMARCINEH